MFVIILRCSGICSDILFGILSGFPFDSDILSGIHSGAIFGTNSGLLSCVLFGIYSDTLSGIFSGILSCFCPTFYLAIFLASISHSFWHLLWQSVAFFLASILVFYLAFTLTFYLVFYLQSILAFSLESILTFLLASYVASILTLSSLYVAFLLTVWHILWHSFLCSSRCGPSMTCHSDS